MDGEGTLGGNWWGLETLSSMVSISFKPREIDSIWLSSEARRCAMYLWVGASRVVSPWVYPVTLEKC